MTPNEQMTNQHAAAAPSCAHIGCQGWNYEDWITGPAADESVFYPRGTRPAAMLDIYTRAFATVEIDSTFYAVPFVSSCLCG
jgi:uncharacterized protein YecE (DUF72 family)